MAMKKCPVCAAPVKLENLERHVRDQHPRVDVDVTEALTVTERRTVRRKHASRRPTMTRKGRWLVVLIAILVAVILLLVIWDPFRPEGPRVGDEAPDFAVDTCSGVPATLSTHLGSVVVFELMDVHCGTCRSEGPVLASVHGTYSGRGVVFLSVSLVDWVPPADTCGGVGDADSIQYFQAASGTSWTYGLDRDRDVRELYKPRGTPTTYVLDREGVIRAKFVGPAAGGAAEYGGAIDRCL